MNTKTRWIQTIVLLVCVYGWGNPEVVAGIKDGFKKKSAEVSTKSSPKRITRTDIAENTFQNQTRPTLDLSALTFNTTFREAINILSNSTSPPLKIVVMWRDLKENAYVEPDTPIQFDGVSGMRLRTGLELVLKSVHSGFDELGYVVQGGVIIIATKPSLPSRMRTRVYDITDLVSQPARYNFGFGLTPGFGRGLFPGGAYTGQGGRMPLRGTANTAAYGRRGRRANRLSDIIRDTVRPNRWR